MAIEIQDISLLRKHQQISFKGVIKHAPETHPSKITIKIQWTQIHTLNQHIMKLNSIINNHMNSQSVEIKSILIQIRKLVKQCNLN